MESTDFLVEAIVNAKEGKRKEASYNLAKALGLSKPTKVIEANIDSLLLKQGPIRNTVMYMAVNRNVRR